MSSNDLKIKSLYRAFVRNGHRTRARIEEVSLSDTVDLHGIQAGEMSMIPTEKV